MSLTSVYEEHRPGFLTINELKELHATGAVDTVIVATVDMQGRLQGKRLTSEFFLDGIYQHGTESCNYLLAVDVDMTTVPGFKMSSWDTGYGDLEMKPDLRSLRWVSWLEKTVLVYCDYYTTSGETVQESPRQILINQLERLEKLGLKTCVGTELEFIMFNDTYEAAQQAAYRELTPSNLYNVDYSLLGTSRVEPLLQDIRNKMVSSGMYCEGAKGECNYGQHEITFRYQDALQSCDNHALYKTGAKEIAAQHGKSITFMAKYNQQEGSSCHIHLSFRSLDGQAVLAGDGEHGFSEMMEHFIAGQLHCLEDFTYFFAPNINSYKRFVEGSFAPTALAWGIDNRSCALRVVGSGAGLRVENRLGGADLNPYLAVAAMIAAGIHGIEKKLPMPKKTPGNAYASDARRLPTTLTAAREKFASSSLVAATFGPSVQDHYAHAAQVEIDTYNATVTDWERIRGFERL